MMWRYDVSQSVSQLVGTNGVWGLFISWAGPDQTMVVVVVVVVVVGCGGEW